MQFKHRVTRRRKFIKIHTGINIKTRHILYNKATASRDSDISILPNAVKKVGNKFNRFLADGRQSLESILLQKQLNLSKLQSL